MEKHIVQDYIARVKESGTVFNEGEVIRLLDRLYIVTLGNLIIMPTGATTAPAECFPLHKFNIATDDGVRINNSKLIDDLISKLYSLGIHVELDTNGEHWRLIY